MRLTELIYKNEYTATNPIPEETEITKIATKISDIKSCDLFIFIKSINFDTNSIIKDIEEAAPKAIVCEEGTEISNTRAHILYVKNARRMCSYIFSRYYAVDYSKSIFVGITGTNGKTTTATLLKRILTESGNSVGFFGSGKIEIMGEDIAPANYSMTTPDPELLYSSIKRMQDYGCTHIVMEASSHALELEKLAPIRYKIAAFTNLSHEHLDFHKSTDNYLRSKLKIFEQSEYGIFNNDDIYARRASLSVHCKVKSIGILYSADCSAREIRSLGFSGSEYIYKEAAEIFKVRLNIPGDYNIYNSLIAIKCALLLGIEIKYIKNTLKSDLSIDGRFEILCKHPTVIIDYAHTPVAFNNVLKSVNSIKNPRQKVILLFGCGGERDREKRKEMAEIAEREADFSIITSDNSRGEDEDSIIDDICMGFRKTDNHRIIKERREAIRFAILSSNSDDIVLLLGKGHERYNIDRNGYHYFNEKEIALAALGERKDICNEN